ncbi:MAG: nucleotide exchange factor GrpE [Nitrospirota bacterium]|nr:nucleotide exchange factor GrpE [Nitrospirota bacterium]MDH5769193.1 nucleotide exchange factor GrpE [Nitrospirota bacterium]
MKKRKLNENQLISDKKEAEVESTETAHELPVDEKDQLPTELQEINDKYVRLYAEFENYKKKINKDKEELVRYGNESLILDLLPVIDNLEMALKHSSQDQNTGIVQGVEITLKEFQRVLEKFGLSPIDAAGKHFDPSVHHAMTQVERDNVDEKTVVEEFRKGYMLWDKVLRPSLVAVSKKPFKGQEKTDEQLEIIEEES